MNKIVTGTKKGAVALLLLLVSQQVAFAQPGGFYDGRRVRTVNPRAAATPAPTPTPTPAPVAAPADTAAAPAPVVADRVSHTAPAETPAAAPSTASRVGFSAGRSTGYILGAAGGGLAAAWPLASRLGMRAGGRFALGVMGASAGLMAANWLIDRVAGRSEFDLMGPLSRRTFGYLAGAIGGGALLAGPAARWLGKVAGLAAGSRMLTLGRFGLGALGVGAGIFAANWLMNRYVQAKANRQIREHDRRWEDQDRELERTWEGSDGYVENQVLGVPMGGAAANANDPLNADEQLRVAGR